MSETPDASGSHRVEAEKVYRDLRYKIIHLDLPPGTRLREGALGREFDMSRTPIRRVLDRLSNDGLVSMSPGSGAVVSDVDFAMQGQVWALRVKMGELFAPIMVNSVPPEVLKGARSLVKKIAKTKNERDLVDAFEQHHMLFLRLVTPGPVQTIYDQLYSQSARMYALMLPRLKFAEELEFAQTEFSAFLADCEASDLEKLAAARLKDMRDALDRLNAVPLMSPLRFG